MDTFVFALYRARRTVIFRLTSLCRGAQEKPVCWGIN